MNKTSHIQSFFWERAPFFRILLPFTAGIICYDHLSPYTITSFYWIIAVCITMLPAGALHLVKRKTYRHVPDLLLFTSLFFLAMSISSLQDIRTHKDWMGFSQAKAEAWEAVVTAPPLEKARTFKLTIAVTQSVNGENSITPAAGKAFLYIYKDSLPPGIQEGDHILIRNRMQPIRNAGNPFEMDYARYAARNNFYFQQFSGRNDIVLLKKSSRLPLLKRCHNWCGQQLAARIQDTATLSVLQAMLIGDEAYLDNDLRQAYSQTGIIHIISISGSHVAVFFLLISGALWWLKHKKYTALKYLLAIGPVWFYVLMAGGPPSAIRAAIMFTLLAIGQVSGRDNNPFNTLMAAAFILLSVQPSWLFSVGFQLSFIAVLSLIIFYKPVSGIWQPRNKIISRLWQATAASLAAEILVSPLVIYYFHSFPAMFLVANIIAWLLMSLLLIAGMMVLAFAWFPWLAGHIATLCIVITTVFNKAIGVLQTFSPASFNRLWISAPESLVIYAVITFTAIWVLQKRRQAVWGLLCSCGLLLLLLCKDEWHTLHQKSLVVYNLSRSNYAELISGKTAAVISRDTGRTGNAYTLQAAHTGFRIEKTKRFTAPVISVTGKKVLFLQAGISDTTQQFPVDVLVLMLPLKKLSFPAIHQMFLPATVVIPGGQSKWYAQQWKDSCRKYGITAHVTATDGAYVLSNETKSGRQ